MSEDSYESPPLAPVQPPSGARYWLGTWSGRLILVNAVVFAVLSVKSGSIMLPDTESLLAFGAKDPVRLAAGEYWRLIAPMFIHIGILHFAVNSYMLYVIGYQLERILGPRWFLLIYLASGFGGNVASAVFSVNMSAGASGALFGLLGAGFYLERSVGRRIMEVTGKRPRNRAYAMTVLINLVFGFVVSFIDNAAHLGGLVTGTLLTYAMVNIRPNTLQAPRRVVGGLVIALLVVAAAVGTYFGTSPTYLAMRLAKAGDQAQDVQDKLLYYTQAIGIDTDDPDLRLKRARLLFFEGESKYAFHDLRIVLSAGGREGDLTKLSEELAARGLATEAWQVRRLAEHGVP